MLNKALRTMEVELIIQMGFFVQDLHRHIAKLHTEQYNGNHHSTSFTVYRGQGLPQIDFEQLKETQGGLMSFNNFLSTSEDRNVFFTFVRRTIAMSNLIGIIFILNINSSLISASFANVRDVSCYKGENEILFSMHSVFRIGQIEQIDGYNRLWQVNLTLTSENDPQLNALTGRIRTEISSHHNGWDRLGMLLVRLGYFETSEELYKTLLEHTNDEVEDAAIFRMLGQIKCEQEKFVEAIEFYEKSIEIEQKYTLLDHFKFCAPYNGIGLVYEKMGEYSKALFFFEKSFDICQKNLPKNHPDLAAVYCNIGLVLSKMDEYSKALLFHEKAFDIFQKTLPENHPNLALSYNNIGLTYENMGDYSKALRFYEKALEIEQKILPPNHPISAIAYANIGEVHQKMGEYLRALPFFEKALEIEQKIHPENHLDLAASYNNIGLLYYNMGECRKALPYYEHALNISQRSLPPNHPRLQNEKTAIELIRKRL